MSAILRDSAAFSNFPVGYIEAAVDGLEAKA